MLATVNQHFVYILKVWVFFFYYCHNLNLFFTIKHNKKTKIAMMCIKS